MLVFLSLLSTVVVALAAPPPERPVGVVTCTPYLTAPILFRAGSTPSGAKQPSPWAVQISADGQAVVNTSTTSGPDFVFEICQSGTLGWNSTGSIKYGHILEPVSGLCLQAPQFTAQNPNVTSDGFTPALGICYYGDDGIQVQKFWALDSSSVLHFVSDVAPTQPLAPQVGVYGRNMTPESTTALQANGTFVVQLTDQGTQNALYMEQAAATTTYSTISTFTTSIAASSPSPIYTPSITVISSRSQLQSTLPPASASSISIRSSSSASSAGAASTSPSSSSAGAKVEGGRVTVMAIAVIAAMLVDVCAS